MRFVHKIGLVVLVALLLGVPFLAFRYQKTHQPKKVQLLPREEVTLTIIPGWNTRDVAEYVVRQGFASTTGDVYALLGTPGVYPLRRSPAWKPDLKDDSYISSKPSKIGFEGYLAPETFRVFKDATLSEVLEKFFSEREKELEGAEIRASLRVGKYSLHEIVTMASIVEREARTPEDRKKVAGILWRRIEAGMPLQVDSSVHYAVDKTGDVFTTDKERSVDSPWNTYKYRGLPPGPICLPSITSIKAALEPDKNAYWYFLSGTDGTMHYAKTLDEHNVNRYKYLR